MSAASLLGRTAAALRDAVLAGELTAADVVRASAARATEVGAGPEWLNAILTRDDAAALDEAEQVDARVADAGPTRARTAVAAELPLAGVPVVLKDNIATLRLPTSCGSRLLEGYVSPFEATVSARLRAAGAVLVGKSNMDEFAMGSSTEHSAFGPTRNPIDPARVPGGSSGGSAAAVAAGMVPVALGSETGGSVRQPAAFCGVVGVKPTYGRVSRFGLVAYASSLDQVGVFGRTVDDAALALEVIAGRDPFDATSADMAVPSYRVPAESVGSAGALADVVVGLPREYYPATLDSRVRARLDAAAEHLRQLGATVQEVTLPHTGLAVPTYYVLAPAEASSNLARFDGVRYGARVTAEGVRESYERTRSAGFGPEVTRRILLGTYVLSAGYYEAYYRKAQEVRALIAHDFALTFERVHVLLTPTTPTPAFPIGAVSDPYEMYLSDVFTVTANLAGVPALSLPVGRANGLPVGAQLIAPHFAEPMMFRVASALEQALGAEAHR